jgi:hypothetical protein
MRRKDARWTEREASSLGTTSGYASEDFQSLCETARELEALRRSGRWGRLLLTAGRRRRPIWRGVRVVRRLPRLELPLTAAPPGQAIRDSVQRRNARVARAVLRLPGERAEYCRGRSRQALRTNVRHAESLGITCHRLATAAEQIAAIEELLQTLGCPSSDREYLEHAIGLQPGRQEFHVAVDASGQVIALAALDVDVRCARLVFLRAAVGSAGGPARYALIRHVIDALIERRVNLLLVGGAVRLAPGLQYFQQRLGFEIFNVRPVAAEDDGAHATVTVLSRLRGRSRLRPHGPATR